MQIFINKQILCKEEIICIIYNDGGLNSHTEKYRRKYINILINDFWCWLKLSEKRITLLSQVRIYTVIIYSVMKWYIGLTGGATE